MTLIGQQLGNKPRSCVDAYPHFVGDLFKTSGKHPAILGVGYWDQDAEPDDYERLHDLLREHAAAGGLFTAYLRLTNPWTGGSHHDINRNGDRFGELINPASNVYNTWMRYLDSIIENLLEIKDLPGLWRPFHECTFAGNAYWNCINWFINQDDESRKQEADDFITVWQHWKNYFDAAGLTNLEWVMSTANRTNPSATDLFPDHEYAQYCGPSLYNGANVISGYNPPTQLVFCEVGNETGRPVSVLNYIPQIELHKPAYALFWSSYQSEPEGHHIAIVDNDDAAEFMNHPTTVCREDLPTTEPINLQIATKFDELAALFRQL